MLDDDFEPLDVLSAFFDLVEDDSDPDSDFDPDPDSEDDDSPDVLVLPDSPFATDPPARLSVR